jgi:hypothetical protein
VQSFSSIVYFTSSIRLEAIAACDYASIHRFSDIVSMRIAAWSKMVLPQTESVKRNRVGALQTTNYSRVQKFCSQVLFYLYLACIASIKLGWCPSPD